MKCLCCLICCLSFILLSAGGCSVTEPQAPDAAAVRQCVQAIQQQNGCTQFFSVKNVRLTDKRVDKASATVIAEVDITVLQEISARDPLFSSPIPARCTGTYWDLDPKKVLSSPRDHACFLVGQELRVVKAFEFQKYESGWRCMSTEMAPISAAFYQNNLVAALLPSFPKSMLYRDARKKLTELGWRPVTLPDAMKCQPRDERCKDYPEMWWCAGTGMAACRFAWKRNDVLIQVIGIGEWDQHVDDVILCESGICR